MSDSLLEAGDTCPAFSLPIAGGGTTSLADFKGRYLILYFYPRADTPGCTVQAQDFTAALPELAKLKTGVIGVSKDPIAKLEKFASKRELEIILGSDEDGDVCETFGVWKEKNMYGKTYMGIERSTVLVGPDGKIRQVWRKVRAKGHAEIVIEAIKAHASA